MTEIWKDIKGYEGLYQVSSLGRVKRTYKNKKERILKIYLRKDGYFQIQLSNQSKFKQFLIHRLIAHAFIPNPDNKPFINHINGVRNDNRIENLEWCTNKENIHHAIKNGSRNDKGENNPNSKLTEEQIRTIKWLLKNSNLKQKEIANMFNVHPTHISSIKRNKYWNFV